MKLCQTKVILSWLLQLITAAILAQTLFFKFTGAEESKYIFSTLGIEPWGRIGTGIAELITVVLILTPRTVTLGALRSWVIAPILFRGAAGSGGNVHGR